MVAGLPKILPFEAIRLQEILGWLSPDATRSPSPVGHLMECPPVSWSAAMCPYAPKPGYTVLYTDMMSRYPGSHPLPGVEPLTKSIEKSERGENARQRLDGYHATGPWWHDHCYWELQS